MAIPTTRNQFKETILRRLGKGVIRVEVSDDQIEDRIDFALAKFRDYHFDGAQEMFYKHQVTPTDIANKYITVPAGTIGVVEIFDLSSTLMGTGMWNVQYQYVLNNIPNWSNLDLANYWITMQHLTLMQQVLVGKQPIRYNRFDDKMYIDMDWNSVPVDSYLVVRLYAGMDPDTFTKIWSDQWLTRYTTELVKQQWGTNTKKYQGMKLPDGNMFNGQQIYDEATNEIKNLDDELINTYSLPVMDMIG